MAEELIGIKAAKRLAVKVQPLASALEDVLKEMAGERVSFVLIMSIGQVTQYAANVDRKGGMGILRELLERWEAGKADIPAHYNPDLRPELLEANYRFPDGRMDWGAVDDELHEIITPGRAPSVDEAAKIMALQRMLRKVVDQ